MSLNVEIKGSNGTKSLETKLTIPLQAIGANSGDPDVNKVSIIVFANSLAKDLLQSVDVSEPTSMKLSTASASGDDAKTASNLTDATIHTAAASTEDSRAGQYIWIKIVTPWSTVEELCVCPVASIMLVKCLFESSLKCFGKSPRGLLFEGHELADRLTLEDYAVKDGSVIQAAW